MILFELDKIQPAYTHFVRGLDAAGGHSNVLLTRFLPIDATILLHLGAGLTADQLKDDAAANIHFTQAAAYFQRVSS